MSILIRSLASSLPLSVLPRSSPFLHNLEKGLYFAFQFSDSPNPFQGKFCSDIFVYLIVISKQRIDNIIFIT